MHQNSENERLNRAAEAYLKFKPRISFPIRHNKTWRMAVKRGCGIRANICGPVVFNFFAYMHYISESHFYGSIPWFCSRFQSTRPSLHIGRYWEADALWIEVILFWFLREMAALNYGSRKTWNWVCIHRCRAILKYVAIPH